MMTDPFFPHHPPIDNAGNDRLCQQFGKLYHAVPGMYVDLFERGILAFQSAKFLRAGEDEYECTFTGRNEMNMPAYFHQEHFLFCLSLSREIQTVRPGERWLYQVNTERLMSALFETMSRPRAYARKMTPFAGGVSLSHKPLAGCLCWGKVEYGDLHEYGGRPAQFVKSTKFKDEHEIRLTTQLYDRNGRIYTTDNPILIPINPTGCFTRVK